MKGKRVLDGQTLVVYSTKITPETRVIMDALAKSNGKNYGQRQLLDQMIRLYVKNNPEKVEKTISLLELFGEYDAAKQVSDMVETKDEG